MARARASPIRKRKVASSDSRMREVDAMMTKFANMLVTLSAVAAIGFAPTIALAEGVKDTGGYDATYTKRDIQPIPDQDGHVLMLLEATCRMKGWIACSWDEPELRFIHLRPMGSSQQSIYVGRMRHGFGQYFRGTGFIFMLASAISRIDQKPYVLGSLAMLWGWLHSAITRKPRYEDPEFRRFLRRYQRRALLIGKEHAVEELYGCNSNNPDQ